MAREISVTEAKNLAAVVREYMQAEHTSEASGVRVQVNGGPVQQIVSDGDPALGTPLRSGDRVTISKVTSAEAGSR